MYRKFTRTRAAALGRALIPGAVVALVAAAAAMATPALAPLNVDPPTITETARQGEVLTAENGTWEDARPIFDTGGYVAIRSATRASFSRPMARHTESVRPTSAAHCEFG